MSPSASREEEAVVLQDDVLILADVLGPEYNAVAAGERPQLDYLELARVLGARLAGHPLPTARRTRALRALPGDWEHAVAVRHARAEALLCLGEGVGLPLSLVKATPARLVMIAHALTTRRRRAFARMTGCLHRFDRIIVVSRGQEAYLRDEVGLGADRVRFVFDSVDHRFFSPRAADGHGGYVLSVGAEGRDYDTLLAAVGRLGVPTVIVPSSLWLSQVAVDELPANVTIQRDLSFRALRELYHEASVVAVPVRAGADYAAGINAVLEAMAMRKPIVVTDTPGLAGYLDDGQTMRTVPGADPAAFADALDRLLSDPATARRLGHEARAVVERGRNVDTYVAEVSATVREVACGPLATG